MLNVKFYRDELAQIKEQYEILTNDFVDNAATEINRSQTFIGSPAADTIINTFNGDIQDIITKLFILKGQLINENHKLATQLNQDDGDINGLKTENQSLSARLSSANDKSAGATGRYDDARSKSYMEFYRTILLLVAGYFVYKQMKSVLAPAMAQVSSIVSEATAKLPSIPKPDINIAALKPNI